jgi:hypothetical protein
MTPKVVSSIPELVAAVRERRDELNISHQCIDGIAGIPDGYTGKLLAPTPLRNFGEMSLGAVLGALALGIAVIVLVDDPDQVELVGAKWIKRKRPQRLQARAPQMSALLSPGATVTFAETTEIDT